MIWHINVVCHMLFALMITFIIKIRCWNLHKIQQLNLLPANSNLYVCDERKFFFLFRCEDSLVGGHSCQFGMFYFLVWLILMILQFSEMLFWVFFKRFTSCQKVFQKNVNYKPMFLVHKGKIIHYCFFNISTPTGTPDAWKLKRKWWRYR